MSKAFDLFHDLEREPLAFKAPGQPQPEDSKERQRKFSDRAAAIEKLKAVRLNGVTKKARQKESKTVV